MIHLKIGLLLLNRLRRLLENKVRSIVEGCSELDKSLSWEERKRHTIEYLESAPNEIRWVTCADKLHNARSMYEDYQAQGESLWSREWYYTSIIESLSLGEPFGLLDDLRDEVERLFRNI
jgi:(p)ppGpp synthase/HD superfamily hydrolase